MCNACGFFVLGGNRDKREAFSVADRPYAGSRGADAWFCTSESDNPQAHDDWKMPDARLPATQWEPLEPASNLEWLWSKPDPTAAATDLRPCPSATDSDEEEG